MYKLSELIIIIHYNNDMISIVQSVCILIN